ncbi:E3 ubiquitin-protein ligase RNF180-like [Oratosquilla oratoria]|uniref:E3 ubiquitin-protein ligase RNF180-like n=1 Tax=Oratosquilla oratoria TaxID=337810 RepID=UPI003F7759EA
MAEATVRCRMCRHLVLKTSEHPVTNGHGEQLNSDSPASQEKCPTLEDRSLLYLSEESLPDFIQDAVTEASWVKGKLKCPQCGARLGSFNFVNKTVCVCGEASVPSIHILNSKVDYLPVGGHIKQPISLPHSSSTRVGNLQEKAITADPQIQDTASEELESRKQPWNSLREENQGLLCLENDRPSDQNTVITSTGSQLGSNIFSSDCEESGTIFDGIIPLNNSTTLNDNINKESVFTDRYSLSINTTACSSLDNDSVSSCHLGSITTSNSQVNDATIAHYDRITITNTQIDNTIIKNSLHSTESSAINQVITVTSQQNTSTTVSNHLRSNSPSSDYELLIKTEESQQQNQQQKRQRRKAKEQRDMEELDSEMKRLREDDHQELSQLQEAKQEQSSIGLQNVGQNQSSRFEVLQTLEDEESNASESKDVPPDLAVPDHLICPVCLDVYYSPFEVKPCGHTFCEPCLRRLAKPKPTETRCPLCRELIGMCQLNRAIASTERIWISTEHSNTPPSLPPPPQASSSAHTVAAHSMFTPDRLFDDYIEEVKAKLSDQHQERHREIRKHHDFTSPLPWIPGYHFVANKPEPRQGIINRLLVHLGLNPLPAPWNIIIEGFMLYLFGMGLAALCHQGKIHSTPASGVEGLTSL